jgi:hypothetical protein
MTDPVPRLRLAVLFDDAGFSPLEIAGAGRDWCDLIWVVGWLAEPNRTSERLLAKLGTVVEVGGLDGLGMATKLAETAPDGLIVFTDRAQTLAADLAERMDLPFHDRRTALLLTDKLAQRGALGDRGVPVPWFAPVPVVVTDPEALCDQMAAYLPMVAKPRRGWGSRHTFVIEDEAALLAFLSSVRGEEFLVEGYLADPVPSVTPLGAPMVSVETVVVAGVAHHLAITGRFPLAPPLRETGSFLPSDLDEARSAEVLDMATRVVDALGVRQGVLHTEVKLTPDGARIIEVNGRVGGGVPRMLERAGGPDLLRLAMEVALGLADPSVAERPDTSVAFFRWVHGPDRTATLRSVAGLDEIGRLPGVLAVRGNRRPDDVVGPSDGGDGHIVAIEGCTANHAELAALLEMISGLLSISYD